MARTCRRRGLRSDAHAVTRGRRRTICTMNASSDLVAAFRDAIGAANVRTDCDLVAENVGDWTGRFHGSTPAVVRPGTVEEVAAVLQLCNESGTAIVPQG